MTLSERRPGSPVREWIPRLRGDLNVRQIGPEGIGWSPERADPVYLDPIATRLLPVIDGEGSIADLVHDVHSVLGVDPEIAEAQVTRVVQLLFDGGLLTDSAPVTSEATEADLFPFPPSP